VPGVPETPPSSRRGDPGDRPDWVNGNDQGEYEIRPYRRRTERRWCLSGSYPICLRDRSSAVYGALVHRDLVPQAKLGRLAISPIPLTVPLPAPGPSASPSPACQADRRWTYPHDHSYVSANTVSFSHLLNPSLSLNSLKSSVSSLSTPVITRSNALSCSMRAFCLSEFLRAFW
jgi:hypothetical protein